MCADGMAMGNIVFAGWLYKHKRGLAGGWVHRWFVLDSTGFMKSCKSDESKDAGGSRGVSVIGNNLMVYNPVVERYGRTNVFRVGPRKGDNFVLSASDTMHTAQWIGALQRFNIAVVNE